MKHSKKIITAVIAVIVCCAFIYGYTDVNARFPQPVEEYYSTGEWISYDETIDIKADGIKIYTAQEFFDKYNIKLNKNKANDSNVRVFAVDLQVKNKSDKSVDFLYTIMKYSLVIQPVGYSNQGELVEEDSFIPAGTVRNMTEYFWVTDALLRESRLKKAVNQDICFCLKAYPVRQAIIFDKIEGWE